jgi:hypothetical protein
LAGPSALARLLGPGSDAVITGTLQQSYDVSLTSYAVRWRASFLHRDDSTGRWIAQVLSFHSTPREAVQRGA